MRWLKKQGVQFESRNGTSHHTATLGDKTTTIPVHPSKEIGTGLAEKIKKQLGLK
jgi:mRNA interferase HicA